MPNLEAIQNMVRGIAAKNSVAVEPLFNTEMSNRIAERLDARRQELAASLYSGKPGLDTPPAAE
jgi:hypothetical protein